MKYYLPHIILCVLATLLIQPSTIGQDAGYEDWHYLISITIDENDYKKYHRPRTIDIDFDEAQIELNGTSVEVQSLKTRGKTSLKQHRKSLTVELEDKVSIPLNTGTVRMKDFYLVSMSLDQHYYYNRFAFDCLKACGIFPLGYRYAEVVVNGETEGVYLLVERPFDHMLDIIGSPYALRRLRSGEIDKDKVAKDVPNSQVNDYRSMYLNLVDRARSNNGKQAYQSLNEALDMSAYYRWLAFNYIVRNGDYTDEVYYYIKPGTAPAQFGIIPWDYDDIFMKEPHEGQETKRRILGHKLLFSSEDPLDREIGTSDYMYQRYLDELEVALDILSPEFMRSTMDAIKRDLIPYLQDADIVEVHKSDHYGGSDATKMEEHMDKIYDYLVERNRNIGLRIEAARE